ncbi:hypothetical protein IWW43_006827, partial [Coemansia sp. RSA 1935]
SRPGVELAHKALKQTRQDEADQAQLKDPGGQSTKKVGHMTEPDEAYGAGS